MDSVTQIKLKSGPISSFSDNLGNDSREPVWSSDDNAEMLFVTNGTAASPTTVNPIVKYRTTSGDVFQFDTVVTMGNENDYVSSPILISSNASKNGLQDSFCKYEFTTSSITVNLYPADNTIWTIYELVIHAGNEAYTSGQVSIYDDTQPVVIDDLYFVTIPSYDIQMLNDQVSAGKAFASIIISDTNGNSYIIPLSPGKHDCKSQKQSYIETNVSSGKPGYDCMETAVSNRISTRNRILFKENSYFHNNEDNIDNLAPGRTNLSNIAEENLSVGGYGSLGTISVKVPLASSESSVNLLPHQNMAKNASNISCVLPYRSGQIPVMEQSNTGDCDRLVLSDSNCALNVMETIPESDSTMTLTCTRDSDVLSYSWSNFSSGVVDITHSDLVNRMLKSKLSPGSFYRITDYETKTTATDTKSIGNLFDIIVLATDTSEISSDAMAINHTGTLYFKSFNSNLSAWKLKYDIFNDKTKYLWATGDDYIIPDGQEVRIYTEDSSEYHGEMATNAYFVYIGTMSFNSVLYYAWKETKLDGDELPSFMSSRYILTSSFIEPGTISYENPYGGSILWVYTDSEGIGHAYNGKGNESAVLCETAPLESPDAVTNEFVPGILGGKGVIYNMTDEHGNECPYDFKNIVFKRKIANGDLDNTSGTETYVFTFNDYDIDNNDNNDMSVTTGQVWINDIPLKCQDNTIKPLYDNAMIGQVECMVMNLNSNVFLNKHSRLQNISSTCTSNHFGINSKNNTIGTASRQNVFGEECSSNTIGKNCNNNSFGNECKGNIMGNACANNFLGDGCHLNTIDNNCICNKIGERSSNNIIKNDCDRCSISSDNMYDIISEYCSEIAILSNCNSIHIGDDNGFYGTYSKNISIAANSEYINIYQSTNEDNSHILGNIIILPGLTGTSSNHINISGISRNNSFTTYVGRNSNNAVVAWNPADMILPNA